MKLSTFRKRLKNQPFVLKNSKDDLKSLVEYLKIKTGKSQEELSLAAGYKQKSLTQAISKESGHDAVIKQLKIVFINELKYSTFIDETENNNYIDQRRNLKNTVKAKNSVPFYDTDALGSITETDMSPIHAPAGTIDVGDLLHDSEAAMRIYGNSMTPNYPSGCVVGLNKALSNYIEPGEVYVLETRDSRIIKRLFYKDDDVYSDFFLCYSDNLMVFEGGSRHGKPAYPPYILPRTEIINLFKVTGMIKRNSNSVIINRNLKP